MKRQFEDARLIHLLTIKGEIKISHSQRDENCLNIFGLEKVLLLWGHSTPAGATLDSAFKSH